MHQASPALRGWVYALFALSGFAGLIYESIWSQYLKLFLGHAAYAQTLVLAIFMGGMAIGAWWAGSIARVTASPLRWYLAAECLLGVAALMFDAAFRGMQGWMYDSVIPALGSPMLVDLARWSAAGLVILPQSILLGATFPLISAALVRQIPQAAGRALGWLYFSNSLGATAGVLCSGFVLIDKVGLPGTILTAGLINFALALMVYPLLRRFDAPVSAEADGIVHAGGDDMRLILAAAALTGAASFCYEIGWIRMLSLLLGSTTQSFELMLSAFILGLALGSFWIRKRIDGEPSLRQWLGWIQLAMASCAFATLPLYLASFGAMSAFSHTVQPNEGGYLLFNLFSYSLCMVLMLPATFCAGMTLPLMTAILLRTGHGERSIGRVYAANTLGSIAGVLVATHLLMPLLGLRAVVMAGALIDLSLGFWLLRPYLPGWRLPQLAAAAAILLVVMAIALSVRFDPRVTASGVYRNGSAYLDAQVLYHADGKTATVDVVRYDDGTVSISTNGKIDAGLNFHGPVSDDDYTMIMLGLLPVTTRPQARTAAVIGMGSGSSTHTLLHDPLLSGVDTIEIEPAMVRGAHQFGEATERTFKDPRSHIRIEDAKTWFARTQQSYDLIVSEPSNPWVSGIASLFSTEFYGQVRRHLNRDGLLVQWLHLYEIDLDLISTVLGALGTCFEDYAIYASNGGDIIIVASAQGRVPALSPWIFERAEFAPPLQRLGMQGVADLQARQLGSKSTMAPYFAQQHVAANSDYFPILGQRSGRQRFINANARDMLQIHPYSLRLEGRAALLDADLADPAFYQPVPSELLHARAAAELLLGKVAAGTPVAPPVAQAAATLRLAAADCSRPADTDAAIRALASFTSAAAAYLPLDLARKVLDQLRRTRCADDAEGNWSRWLQLYEGVALRQPELVRAAAPVLLPRAQAHKADAQFLQAELLLAHLQLGDLSAAAAQLAHVKGLPDSAPLSYLRANVAHRMNRKP